MKLRVISEQVVDLKERLLRFLREDIPDRLIRRLFKFVFASGREFTKPGDRHTSSVAREELLDGRRLAALVWKDDIDCDVSDLYVVCRGNDTVMSLPANKDIADIISAGVGGRLSAHAFRGLVFGYDPSKVLWFVEPLVWHSFWRDYIRSFGIRLAQDDGGYASVVKKDGVVAKRFNCEFVGNIVVFPGEFGKVSDNLQNFGKLLYASKHCPECNADFDVFGCEAVRDWFMYVTADGVEYNSLRSSKCPHRDSGWYNFEFDLTGILDKLKGVTL